MKTALADKGLDLELILQGIKDNEELGRVGPYADATVQRLNSIINLFPAEFELVKMMHESFTANTPDGEREGGWPSCIYRCFKIPAAAMMVVAANFVLDTGIDGNNGKGVLWAILINCLGAYACTVDEGILTKDSTTHA